MPARLVLPASSAAVAKPCLSRLQLRQQSSHTASCSYSTYPSRARSQRSRRAPKVAESDVAEPEQDEEYQESLPQDLLSLLSPRTKPTPLLTPQEVLENLYDGLNQNAVQHYHAFYSSELRGIVTDPALMMVHVDDHMVHRGHAVFDTAIIVDGYAYQLDEHLERLQRSAVMAGLSLPSSIEQLSRTILETAAASKQVNAHIKYWLAAGRGGFGLSGFECPQSSFYCQVYTTPPVDVEQTRYMRVKTSAIPIKAPYFATVKSNNYLPNALALMDAQQDGFDQGIFVDDNGMVAEGPNMNLGIITHANELVVPPFESSLGGITIMTLMQQVEENIGTDDLEGIDSVVRRHFSVDEAKAAKEVFLAGSSLPVVAVIAWDSSTIGTGLPGRGAMALRGLIENHMNPANNMGQHTEVPYGYITGIDAYASVADSGGSKSHVHLQKSQL